MVKKKIYSHIFFPPKLKGHEIDGLTPNLKKFIETESPEYVLKALREDKIAYLSHQDIHHENPGVVENQRFIIETTLRWWRHLCLWAKDNLWMLESWDQWKEIQKDAKNLLCEVGRALIPEGRLADQYSIWTSDHISLVTYPIKGRPYLIFDSSEQFCTLYKKLTKGLKRYIKRRYHNPQHKRIPPGKQEDIQRFAKEQLNLEIPDKSFHTHGKRPEIKTGSTRDIVLSIWAFWHAKKYKDVGFLVSYKTLKRLLKEAKDKQKSI